MNFFLLFCIVLATVSVSSATELRKVRRAAFPRKNVEKKGLKMQNMADGSTFPSSPTYAIIEMYTDSACTTLSSGNSYVLDTCLADASTSSKLTCASNVGTMITYSDATCTTQDKSNSATVGDCTASGGGEYMKLISCGGSDGTAYSEKMITEKVFQKSGCSDLLGSNAYIDGYCMTMVEGGVTMSVALDWPKAKVYSSADCTGTVLDSTSISTKCEAPATDDYPAVVDDDYTTLTYNSYTKVSYGSGAFSNFSFGFGALVSALMVALQLVKN